MAINAPWMIHLHMPGAMDSHVVVAIRASVSSWGGVPLLCMTRKGSAWVAAMKRAMALSISLLTY